MAAVTSTVLDGEPEVPAPLLERLQDIIRAPYLALLPVEV